MNNQKKCYRAIFFLLWGLIVIFLYVDIPYCYAQTIHQNDLTRFVGKFDPSLFFADTLHSPFVEDAIDDSSELLPLTEAEAKNGIRRIAINPYVEWSWRPMKTAVIVKEKDIAAAIFVDTNTADLPSRVGFLSFWKLVGDSLKFQFLENTSADAIAEYAIMPDSSLLLVLCSADGDAEDISESFQFVRYNDSPKIESIYRKSYHYTETDDKNLDPRVTLRLMDGEKKTLMARFIEKKYEGSRFNEAGDLIDERLGSKVVRADTLFVDLWKLVKERSAH